MKFLKKALISLAYHLARFLGTDQKQITSDVEGCTSNGQAIRSSQPEARQLPGEKDDNGVAHIPRRQLRGGAIFEKIDVRYHPLQT
jgi:hypothetical protein